MPEIRILSEFSADDNPFTQFHKWYSDHLESGTNIPDWVVLATASSDGRVSARTVLLKGYNDKSFIFFTNYNSLKGRQLASNPRAALLFYWNELGRQVRIEGITEKVSDDESEAYFKTRPRMSQLSAWASEQSSIIPSREYLLKQLDFYDGKFNNEPVRRPAHWGGYRLLPDWFEFWHDGKSRLHDRITYTRTDDSWRIGRLAP